MERTHYYLPYDYDACAYVFLLFFDYLIRHLQLVFEHWTRTNGAREADMDADEFMLARKIALFLRNMLSKALETGIKRTDRLEKLLSCLRTRYSFDKDNFRAIVFIQRRVACRVLYEYLNTTAPFKFICGFAIGRSTSSGLAAHGLRDQKYPVVDFSAGRTKVRVMSLALQLIYHAVH